MLKILKNLKNSWKSVLIIFILLCIQAGADLKLPNFTSQIVNVGIQQGGIESALPEAIRKSTLDNIKYITKDYDKIVSKYELVEKNDESIKKYPIIEKEAIYQLKDITNQEKEELEENLATPLMMLNMLGNEEYKTQITQSIKDAILNNSSNINNSTEQFNNNASSLNAILETDDVFQIIKMLPENATEGLLDELNTRTGELSDSIKEQSAISYIKTEYEAIGMDTTKISNMYILRTGIQMLGVAIVSMGSAILIMYFSSKVAAKLGKDLREKVFKKALSFSTKEFSEFGSASLITRNTNDIQIIQELITMLFRVVVYAPIMAIGGLIMVISTSNLSMAWIIGLAVVIIIIIVGILFATTMPKFKLMQTLIDKLNLVSREILTGIPVIRAFNTQKKEEKRFEEANQDLMKSSMFVNRIMSLMAPMMTLIMQSIILLIIWVGGHNIDSGIMQVGDMMAFLQYAMQIIMSFLMISMISIILPRAAISANRINEVIEKVPSIEDKPEEEQDKFDENKKGLIEFQNVSFRYPGADEDVLTDITFTAKPGETTAIIGSTGSGKSTVVNLIPRFYDVTSGKITVDGADIRNVKQKELREKIGYVPQRGILFSGTIESNIKYGKDISDEEMEMAADIAQAKEFIDNKEDKYKSEIAQGGNNVSGGQKQRLSIARALAIDPEIFVFDDSFSALDLKTDRKLRDALKKRTKGKTVIIVAQRVSTILNAEQIIVLEEGKIVGKGTHEELLENCETYRQIATSQLSEQELKRKEM